MLINEDLTKPVLIHADRVDWVPSPAKGVDRRMLFRIGEEKARATSIVRYASGSRFARHEHTGGEEFLVLDGVFQDESGDFPVGTYVRNPPGTGHAPGSDEGCVILVKLWQFRADDRERVVCRPGEGEEAQLRPGVSSSRILFDGKDEQVMMEEWQPGAAVEVANPHGLELLVLGGGFTVEGDVLDHWSWLRLPAGQAVRAKVGNDGARVWMKSGPLLHEDVVRFEDAGTTKDR
ncbi:cupin domain-containing protein [Sinorhizobium meliloti]|uniref:Cupin n=1 Tax=Rhizobium meliloti TaxID=382 RepID=A0A2J0Z974_RHIML|nr:cupin domain-containing protein [Sinorhizobium meliloti]PJR17079.1 cupin [Sinorhizobium meliloti]